MRIIKLTTGQNVYLDSEDFEKLSSVRWSLSAGKYAANSAGYMHHEILPKREGFTVDHIDGNTFNNARSNLRYATKSQNGMNRGPNKNNRSGLKGVSWSEERGKWIAQTKLNGKTIPLGRYKTKEEAHEAYMIFIKQNHGDFARGN